VNRLLHCLLTLTMISTVLSLIVLITSVLQQPSSFQGNYFPFLIMLVGILIFSGVAWRKQTGRILLTNVVVWISAMSYFGMFHLSPRLSVSEMMMPVILAQIGVFILLTVTYSTWLVLTGIRAYRSR
jgi:hypothetical protein